MWNVLAKFTPALMILFLVTEITALIGLSQVPWDVRLGIPLQIIAFYGIGLGLIARSATLRSTLNLEDMTSHNLDRFISANMIFLSLPVFTAFVAGNKLRRRGEGIALGCLGHLLWLASSPLLMGYVIFHFVVVMPITYLGYVVASALFESIRYSAVDQEYGGGTDAAKTTFGLREIIIADQMVAKTFIVGIPAAVLTLALKLTALFAGLR